MSGPVLGPEPGQRSRYCASCGWLVAEELLARKGKPKRWRCRKDCCMRRRKVR
jgi:hypothetical protein